MLFAGHLFAKVIDNREYCLTKLSQYILDLRDVQKIRDRENSSLASRLISCQGTDVLLDLIELSANSSRSADPSLEHQSRLSATMHAPVGRSPEGVR